MRCFGKARIRAVVIAAGLVALAGCAAGQPGSDAASASPASAAARAAEANPNLDLGSSLGGTPAPGFRLDNQFGQPMSLSQFRGKVIILAFIDSQCTTVCPLTTVSMLEAKQLLGAAGEHVQLLGIDANPQATSVSDVLAYSRAHGMVNQWDFLTASAAKLRATWSAFHIAVQIDKGLIDHTPALYVIDQHGREQKIYLTQMAYSSITQSAEILATEVSSLLPGHPGLASQQSLASVPAQSPKASVKLPAATGAAADSVPLGPGKPRLTVFFVTWLSEVSDLRSQLTGLNAYVTAAAKDHLPQLTAVDEATTEPSVAAVRSYLAGLGQPLRYPVGLDSTGRVGDGYGVQDQPWFVLTSASGKIVWSHDGWLPVSALQAAVRSH